MRLEGLLAGGFGLKPSPLQLAICRAADGSPLDKAITDEACEAHFGCELEALGREVPTIVAVVAGVRGGKSALACCATVRCAFDADLRALLPHEIARGVIVSPTTDNATATYRLLLGLIENTPALRRGIEGPPTADALMLRRPDGKRVELSVVAAHRGGIALRSRWLVSAVLDEAALFGTESAGAVVNAEELLRAGETRLVPGGQVWLTSSPYGPSGLLFDLWRAHFGKPGRTLVVRAPTRALNPAFPIAQIEAVRLRDPDAASREYDAAWCDADSAFLDGVSIDSAVRPCPLELPPGAGFYAAAWDAATRGNSWTLVIVQGESKGAHGKMRVALARQWTGSRVAPLDPERVVAEAATILRRYQLTRIKADAWGLDPLRSIANRYGLQVVEESSSTEARANRYERIKSLLATGALELAPVPQLVSDLKGLRKRATGNSIRIELPRTADGRHCDYAPSLAIAATSLVASAGIARYDDEVIDMQRMMPKARDVLPFSSGSSAGWVSDADFMYPNHSSDKPSRW